MHGFRLIGAAAVLAMTLPTVVVAKDRYRDRDRDRYGYGYNHHGHHHDHDGSAAAGAVLGLAIVGIAAAASKRNRDDRRDWGNAFSPDRDVTCYRDQRQCFWRDRFSADWTDSQFGYDPYNRSRY